MATMSEPGRALRLLLGEADVYWPDEHSRLAPSLLQEKLDDALAEAASLDVEALREMADRWWDKSQADKTIIHDAGIMQEMVIELRTILARALPAADE